PGAALVLKPLVLAPLVLAPWCWPLVLPLVLAPGAKAPLVLAPLVLAPLVLAPLSTGAVGCQFKLTSLAGCPSDPSSAQLTVQQSDNKQQCAMLCTKQSWCAALIFTAARVCQLFTAETVLLGWKASCGGQSALVFNDRLLSFHTEYLAARSVTRKRVYIPNNSAKIFATRLVPEPTVSTLIGCVAKCSATPSTCRGILFNSSNCSLLNDYPLCRWFGQPPGSPEFAVYEFYTVLTQQCFETVNLRVSDALSFDRLWADYKAGFGTYHDNYFVGLEWLHTRTSAQPSNNRFRVDLLYWDDTYIYAYYVNIHILAESTNYTLSAYTFVPGGGLGNCLFGPFNMQFMTRDRGWSDCAANCAVVFLPHWHKCCHCSGPFGRYFNYPYALNVSAADRAKGIVWASNAPSNVTDGWYYSFKQLEILMLT
uniref:Fibrinogen C-terminal domain-containing protein n=1 Tax=Macrostomum lignano TaxID=282301 RepID=A0A1I8IX12_9PLAT